MRGDIIKYQWPTSTPLPSPRNECSTRIHRLDLQGLRGVAILSVLGFHFFPAWFPNGYVGVDQFFVLSGYLMARILDNDPTSILDFYYRRSKRIVPMYVLATLLTLWSCFFLYPESILNLNVKSAVAAVTFISNFWPLERKYTGYFAELAVADDLFIHTWSLAVEVQFYLIVPVLSILCKKTSFRISATCLIVIGALSLAFHLLSDATTAFYNPLARIWEFLTGYAAYLMSSRTAIEPALCEKPRNSAECEQISSCHRTTRHFVEFFCLLALLYLLPHFLKLAPLRIATTMVTGVIVAYGNNLLSSRCFVHFGDTSYTLYLVHWPIFCWLKLSGNCNASDCMAGALLAWFLSVLLTRTYETWYRAADKYTIVVMIIILYALTGVTLVQSHNLKAFVNEYNLSLDRQIAAEYLYTNITLDDAIRLNKKFDAEFMKNQYYDRCEYVEKGSKWWCKFKDMNKSASASILIIGNCWAPNHARIIHESCKNRSRVMTLYGFPGCDVLVETSRPHCKTTFAGYVQYIKETTPDYLFVIVKYQQNVTEQSESVNGESFVKQFYTRTQSLQKLVKRRIFILDILPRFIPSLVSVLNSKLSQQKIFNQTELLQPFPVDFTRSVLRKAIASCEKCTLISYDDVFGNGSSFRFFDENTKVTFFAGHHISPYGLRKVAPIYEKICASF